MTEGSKRRKSMEVARWFYLTQRALLCLQISLLSNQSLWWIIFLHLEVLELKRKKRAEEKAKLSREEDYPWTELCENLTKLKKLRVPELNKYLNHLGLKQHLKSSMNVLQLPLLSHSCCFLNAASARGGLSTCLVLEHVAF